MKLFTLPIIVLKNDLAKINTDSLFIAKLCLSVLILTNIQCLNYFIGFPNLNIEPTSFRFILYFLAVFFMVYLLGLLAPKNLINSTELALLNSSTLAKARFATYLYVSVSLLVPFGV